MKTRNTTHQTCAWKPSRKHKTQTRIHIQVEPEPYDRSRNKVDMSEPACDFRLRWYTQCNSTPSIWSGLRTCTRSKWRKRNILYEGIVPIDAKVRGK